VYGLNVSLGGHVQRLECQGSKLEINGTKHSPSLLCNEARQKAFAVTIIFSLSRNLRCVNEDLDSPEWVVSFWKLLVCPVCTRFFSGCFLRFISCLGRGF
jgi:hypothetical protein